MVLIAVNLGHSTRPFLQVQGRINGLAENVIAYRGNVLDEVSDELEKRLLRELVIVYSSAPPFRMQLRNVGRDTICAVVILDDVIAVLAYAPDCFKGLLRTEASCGLLEIHRHDYVQRILLVVLRPGLPG